ncbi:unnamed protein product, partial [Rotaria sp. Silwood1]
MQILLDTGATTTFINKKLVAQYPFDFLYLNTLPYSFVLADGIAPFHVHGVVELHIEIANQITTIKAHVAENLCTDLILGIDYIIQYNLKFDIRRQFVSIEHNNKLYQIKFDHDVKPQYVPVIASNSIHIPSHSNYSVLVSTCISSTCSLFVPHSYFSSSCHSLTVPQKFLEFHNYVSHITLSNLSFRTQYINQGTCLGYLCQYSSTPQSNKIIFHSDTPCGAANLIGDEPVLLGVSNDKATLPDVTQLTKMDYKKLNLITIKDSSPLPNMEDTIRKLGPGYQYFSKINYLGHTIDKDTIKPMTENIDAILNIKDPCTLTAANKFIGALSWYRKFIPGFASVASPIHSVTNLTRNNRRKFQWKFAQSQAFQRLKQMLVSEPLFLHYPVDDKPIILTTDASGVGIGGVLQQE